MRSRTTSISIFESIEVQAKANKQVNFHHLTFDGSHPMKKIVTIKVKSWIIIPIVAFFTARWRHHHQTGIISMGS